MDLQNLLQNYSQQQSVIKKRAKELTQMRRDQKELSLLIIQKMKEKNIEEVEFGETKYTVQQVLKS